MVPSQGYPNFWQLLQNPKFLNNILGFSNHAQRFTPPYYLNVDNPFNEYNKVANIKDKISNMYWKRKNTTSENFHIYLNVNYVWKLLTANKYIAHTLLIKSTKRNPCRLLLVWQGSSHWFTLLIHSTRLERQRSQALDSFKSLVSEVVVGRGSFQK